MINFELKYIEELDQVRKALADLPLSEEDRIELFTQVRHALHKVALEEEFDSGFLTWINPKPVRTLYNQNLNHMTCRLNRHKRGDRRSALAQDTQIERLHNNLIKALETAEELSDTFFRLAMIVPCPVEEIAKTIKAASVEKMKRQPNENQG